MNYDEYQIELQKMRQLAHEAGIKLFDDNKNLLSNGDVFAAIVDRWEELTEEHRTALSCIIADLFVANIVKEKKAAADKEERKNKCLKMMGDDVPLELQIWAMTLLSVGISIVKDDGELITDDEYMRLLSEKWNTFTDAERAAVSVAHMQQMLVNYIKETNENGGYTNETAND